VAHRESRPLTNNPYFWVVIGLCLVIVVFVTWFIASRPGKEQVAVQPVPAPSTVPMNPPSTQQPQQPSAPPAQVTQPPQTPSQPSSGQISGQTGTSTKRSTPTRRTPSKSQAQNKQKQAISQRPQASPSQGGRGSQTQRMPEQATSVSGIQPGTDLPHKFKYQGTTWVAFEDPTQPNPSLTLTKTQDTADNHPIYVPEGETKPYDTVFLKLDDNSGRYLLYEQQPSVT
jgi:hypothetical protein